MASACLYEGLYNLVFPSAKQGSRFFLVTALFIGKALSDHIESGCVRPRCTLHFQSGSFSTEPPVLRSS
jgi:hypothetical protein